MGLSECLASISYHGEFEVTSNTSESVVDVQSVLPSDPGAVVVDGSTKTCTEKMPREMTASKYRRKTTGHGQYTFSPDSDLSIRQQNLPVGDVNGRTVVFD
jgi:CRISPR-associated protein Cas5h